jgi:hypothetical protein
MADNKSQSGGWLRSMEQPPAYGLWSLVNGITLPGLAYQRKAGSNNGTGSDLRYECGRE